MTARTTSRALAEAVDPALALLVAGRVPGQVVVDDGVEVLLEVDALGQAVGGDQHVVAVACRSARRRARALGRRQLTGDGCRRDRDASWAERVGEVLGDVVGGVDEAAEDDGVVAVGEQLLDLAW